MMRIRAIFGAICVLLALIQPVHMDLFVTANTYELIGFIGKGVTMYATVRGDPAPGEDNIVWIKVGSNLPTERIDQTFDVATNESRLRINELEYSDAGVYYCVVTVNGVTKSVSMTLKVVVEPGVERITQLITPKAVGQNAIFSVSVSGNPLPTAENITWTKLDSLGLPSVTSHPRWSTADEKKELTITNLEIEDEGWYKCLVFTDEGKADVSFNLHVLGMRSIQATGTGVVGNSASLTCTATYYQMLPSNPSIQWYRSSAPTVALTGTTITRSVNDHAVSVLTLDDLTWDDEGDYFCNSTYSGFPQDSIKNATLYIRGIWEDPERPKGVLGQSALLSCRVRGDVRASVYWQRNGVNITGEAGNTYEAPYTNATLLYSALVSNDETAQFKCIAEFDSNTTTATSGLTSISVLEVSTPPGSKYGVISSNVSLGCTVESPPTPLNISWLHEHSPVPDTAVVAANGDSGSSLTLVSVTRASQGNYYCSPYYSAEGTFTGGNATSEPGVLTIVGISTPPHQTIVKTGDSATFTCIANATPMPTLSWTKSGVPRSDGVIASSTADDYVTTKLVINNVGDDDVANYACKAEYPNLGTHVSDDAFLRFRGIEVAPVATRAVINQANSLNCTARGESVASLEWRANGTVITSNDMYNIVTSDNSDTTTTDLVDTRSILDVATVSLDTSYLQYTCTATWVAGDSVSEIVSEPVAFIALYVYESPVAAIAVRYTPVQLTCSAREGPLIRWDRSGRTYGNGLLKSGPGYVRSTLTIGNVTTADAGSIWCVADYTEGVHNSEKALLTVVGITEEPQSVDLTARGQTARFTCKVDRYPPHNMTWYKGGEVLEGYQFRKNMTSEDVDDISSYYLTVEAVTEEDMDNYTCKVQYSQGAQTSQPAALNIREPPQISLIIATGDKAGENIELLCEAVGVPKPSITWRRQGQDFPSSDVVSVVSVYNEPGRSLVLINSSNSEDQGVYTCVASNGVGETVLMDTEVTIASGAKVVTVASASSLLVVVVAVCTALMLFALYRKRKRKRQHPAEEKGLPKDEEAEAENHVYANEASVFGDVKSCQSEEDEDVESGIESDGDIPTVEPPEENPALFLMPDRKSKELPPLDKIGSPLALNPIFSSAGHTKAKSKLPSVSTAGTLPPLQGDIFRAESQLNAPQQHTLGVVSEDEMPTMTPYNMLHSGYDTSSPCPSGYVSATDMSSSIGLPESVVEHPREPYRKLSRSTVTSPQNLSPDPHYVPHDDD